MQKVAWPRMIVQNENGISARLKRGAERDAGDDAGQRDRQRDQQRHRLAAEEAIARHGRSGAGVPSTMASAVEIGCDAERQAERLPDVRPVPGDREPLQREARRRELVALLLRREGVEEDEQAIGRCRNSSPAAAASVTERGGRLGMGRLGVGEESTAAVFSTLVGQARRHPGESRDPFSCGLGGSA